MPSYNYPPAFSQNAISTVFGHVSDFSGNDPTQLSNASAVKPLSATSGNGGGLAPQVGDSVPVVITGSRPPSSPHFPGLREAMLGSAIYQLAEQIPAGNPIAEKIMELAEELHRFGAKTILENQVTGRAPKSGGRNGKKGGRR